MDKAEKILWEYLINKGYVIESESYYGNLSDIDQTLTIRNDMAKIDWDKSTPIKQDTEYKFDGTFSENLTVEYLYGELSYRNKKYTFHLELDGMSIIDLVKEVLSSE